MCVRLVCVFVCLSMCLCMVFCSLRGVMMGGGAVGILMETGGVAQVKLHSREASMPIPNAGLIAP